MDLNKCKVIRGISWKWENQDGGEGCLGTVINHDKSLQKATVQWDQQNSNSGYFYDVGKDNNYALRVFDNSLTGVRHSTFGCDECETSPISGFRWQCSVCINYDLCTLCYMTDKHISSHSFYRIDTPQLQLHRVKLSPRCYSTSKSAKRLKPGDWGVQNRIDDLQYYIHHLPLAGFTSISLIDGITHGFNVGDRVTVELELDVFEEIQSSGNNWSNEMAQLCNCVSTVIWIYENGDCQVLPLNGSETTWRINIASLYKVGPFSVGDFVKIEQDEEKFEKFQRLHSNWDASQKQLAGKVVEINSIDNNNGNLKIHINGETYELSPVVCDVTSQEEETSGISNSIATGIASSNELSHDDSVQRHERGPRPANNSSGTYSAEASAFQPIPEDGLELAIMMTQGSRVKRGRNWKWSNQDDNGIGTVVHPVDDLGLIIVKWDCNDRSFRYRMGADNRYDLTLEHDTRDIAPELGESSDNDNEVSSSSFGLRDESSDSSDDDNEVSSTTNSLGLRTIADFSGMEFGADSIFLDDSTDSDSENDSSTYSDSDDLTDSDSDSSTENEEDLLAVAPPLPVRTPQSAKPPVPPKPPGLMNKVLRVKPKTFLPVQDSSSTSQQSEDCPLNSTCDICMDNRRNVVFLCGHGTCNKCAKSLKRCHLCRKKIKKIIKIF